MGAWGTGIFDNDTAGDWASGLDDVADLSLVDAALQVVEASAEEYLEEDVGSEAIDRVLGEDSELPELWEGQQEWLDAVADLRRRVVG